MTRPNILQISPFTLADGASTIIAIPLPEGILQAVSVLPKGGVAQSPVPAILFLTQIISGRTTGIIRLATGFVAGTSFAPRVLSWFGKIDLQGLPQTFISVEFQNNTGAAAVFEIGYSMEVR